MGASLRDTVAAQVWTLAGHIARPMAKGSPAPSIMTCHAIGPLNARGIASTVYRDLSRYRPARWPEGSPAPSIATCRDTGPPDGRGIASTVYRDLSRYRPARWPRIASPPAIPSLRHKAPARYGAAIPCNPSTTTRRLACASPSATTSARRRITTASPQRHQRLAVGPQHVHDASAPPRRPVVAGPAGPTGQTTSIRAIRACQP